MGIFDTTTLPPRYEPMGPLWKYKPAGFQKCPVCNGSGEVKTTDMIRKCEVCEGQGIINKATGKPPQS